MTSIFSDAGQSELKERLGRIAAQDAPRWGKMNGAQMFVHCRRPLELAFGERHVKRGLVGLLFGGFFKKRLVNGSMPFKPGLPTDPAFLIVDEREFEEERRKLLERLAKCADQGPAGLTRERHPFFGRLTPDEWDRLMWKHLEHHLRQFGV